MHKVALWGVGDGYNLFSQLHGFEMVEVIVIADTKMGGIYNKIDGIPVIFPNELTSFSFDYLIICAYYKPVLEEIIAAAVSLGINRNIILPLRIFQIPFFNFDDYIRIKNSNISILSDSCFAGYLYHKFGMQFTSPTINMFADNENYLRFLKDIKGHFNESMVEVDAPVEHPYWGKYAYPRGLVGDSEWVFNHDASFETAAERWKRGVERFNFDNYLVIMSLMSESAANEFDQLPIEHKIGFYWKDLGLKSVVYMPEWNSADVRAKLGFAFVRLVNLAADEGCGIRSINWMKALLHEEDYRRVE